MLEQIRRGVTRARVVKQLLTTLVSAMAAVLLLACVIPEPHPDMLHQSKTTDTWSFEFDNKEEKLQFLLEYLIAPSEIYDAEYLIQYHDNGGGPASGPSDWDIRVALLINPHDLSLWLEGLEELPLGEIDLLWWAELETERLNWHDSNALSYRRPGQNVFLVAFPEQGIILKSMSTQPSQLNSPMTD